MGRQLGGREGLSVGGTGWAEADQGGGLGTPVPGNEGQKLKKWQ